jgi:nitrite reductase/ring-hydroxylating ferredoxin subunit
MNLICWYKAEQVTVSDLEEGKLTEICVAGKRIGLLKKSNTIVAFAALCPHAGAALCSGWLDGFGRIVCPEHKYRFDPANGRNTSGEGYKLVTYQVQLMDDAIFVGFIKSADTP